MGCFVACFGQLRLVLVSLKTMVYMFVFGCLEGGAFLSYVFFLLLKLLKLYILVYISIVYASWCVYKQVINN